MKKETWEWKERIKRVAIRAVRGMIRVTYVLPVRDRRVFIYSYGGAQYACNPRAVSEYLVREHPGEYEVIWAFQDPERFAFLREQGIQLVQYRSLQRLICQVTAKYCINNSGGFSWNPRRKGQYHINTWHAGGAYKRLQHDAGADTNRRLTARETSHMISSCALFTKYNIREQFGFQGTVLEIGMPRNDVFFAPERMAERNREVRRSCGIPEDSLIVLFAPTWRYDGQIPEPDYDVLSKSVREKWGRDAVILVRNHSLSRKNYAGMKDVTDYGDMQDLLCAADLLITDYSSAIWDYSLTGRPCFLFVPDLEKYTEEQGFYTDIRGWGFPLCRDDRELREAILSFDSTAHRARMEKHQQDFGSFERGDAARRFCEAVFS